MARSRKTPSPRPSPSPTSWSNTNRSGDSMLVLDENLPEGQRLLLRKRRVRFRVIGMEVASSGANDENLIAALHQLPNPTFFSLDRDFFRADWAHASYGLVWLDVRGRQAAEFIRRFLRHPRFDTQARRMGTVARVHPDGIQFWQRGKPGAQTVTWPET